MLGLRRSWDTINHVRAHPGLRTFAHGCAQTPRGPAALALLSLTLQPGDPQARKPRSPPPCTDRVLVALTLSSNPAPFCLCAPAPAAAWETQFPFRMRVTRDPNDACAPTAAHGPRQRWVTAASTLGKASVSPFALPQANTDGTAWPGRKGPPPERGWGAGMGAPAAGTLGSRWQPEAAGHAPGLGWGTEKLRQNGGPPLTGGGESRVHLPGACWMRRPPLIPNLQDCGLVPPRAFSTHKASHLVSRCWPLTQAFAHTVKISHRQTCEAGVLLRPFYR